MTGIGGLLFESPPPGVSRWRRLVRRLRRILRYYRGRGPTRFVVLCFRRTGSNWLCGMLFNHPEILMHNEIFNENGVHTYYKADVLACHWDFEGRDVNPEGFLEFMYNYSKFAKFRGRARDCKAVGYKSFPNHYLQHSVPLESVNDVFQRMVLGNPDVKKIILKREDIVRTYISSRRAFETGIYITGSYQDHRVEVDIVDMQRFVDRYQECYAHYEKQTCGHVRCMVTYEELCDDQQGFHAAMSRIWQLLDVSNEEPLPLAECKPQSLKEVPLSDSISNYSLVEYAYRHDVTLGKYFEPPHDSDIPDSHCNSSHAVNHSPPCCKWALLIPVRAGRDDSAASCCVRLQRFHKSLLQTARPEPDDPLLIFGVDDDDDIYRDGQLLRTVFAGSKVEIEICSGLQGKICKIWERLAACAYQKHGIDLTCLVGDDVILRDVGWQEAMEASFSDIARKRNLPFGAACVAFVDNSFMGFPTFPVIHKWHFEAFSGALLPSQFDNQGGDPFLFELYKRFGASQFATECSLENTIGGKEVARYTKQRLRFEDDILTSAVRQVEKAINGRLNASVQNGGPIPGQIQIQHCLDVVIPTYRCDMKTLHRITQLRTTWPAQVSFWIVLDNPSHPNAQAVRNLRTVSQNYQINVLEQLDRKGEPQNYGASAARNYGLAHSKAEHAVLLDDDVDPDKCLLDAYLGAAMRWPNASVFVGSTYLPPPHNWLTHAIVASDIPGAYTIAERVREPPWGVTANLCVKARTSRLRFDLSYPKSGGGEDLDYCARARRHGPVKSVPGARATHPWWNSGDLGAIGHILGWAEGEIKCVSKPALREHVFFSLPNGVELVILVLPVSLLLVVLGVYSHDIFTRCMLLGGVVLILEVCWHSSRIGVNRLRSPMKECWVSRTKVRMLAAILIMLQEATRFLQALSHSPTWLFWRVDWHFGQSRHMVAARKRNDALRAMCYVALFVLFTFRGRSSKGTGGDPVLPLVDEF